MKRYNRLLCSTLLIAFAAGTNAASASPDKPVRASCATKTADARALTNYPAEWPGIALQLQATGKAIVQIALSDSGAVRNAAVVVSSGNASLDQAAKEATLHQRYAAEVRDCATVSGSYLVEVDFPR